MYHTRKNMCFLVFDAQKVSCFACELGSSSFFRCGKFVGDRFPSLIVWGSFCCDIGLYGYVTFTIEKKKCDPFV